MPPRYLLDTNVLSEPSRAQPDPGVERRLADAGDDVATAAPIWHELHHGRERLTESRRRRAIDALLANYERVLVVLPYDAAAARWHARERARLAKAGQTAPFVDGQIAAIAAVHGLTLVTRNVKDFTAFHGLSVESWFSARAR